MRVKLRSINVAPKARSSKAQGGRARDSGLWNPGSGIEERSALKGRHRFFLGKPCAALSAAPPTAVLQTSRELFSMLATALEYPLDGRWW